MRSPDYSPQLTIQQRCLTRMRQATLRQQSRTLTAEQETKRTASETSLLRWGRTYLPTHFVKAPSQMHLWLANWLDREQPRGWKLNILAPRGGAKSTLVTLAYALRAALLNREPYIWIVSDTVRQASNHLENLRAEISDNSRLLRDYATATGRGPRWRNNLLELNNGVVIEAIGTGQRVRGRRRREARPTLIIGDDLQSDRHMESPDQRELSRRWFQGMLMKAGTPTTNVINLATALHREALAWELQSTPGWTSQRFAAIIQWPTNMQLWQEWESIYCDPSNPRAQQLARTFYKAHRREMNAGAQVLWPEVEDLYTLMQQRAESGRAAFAREKQNEPTTSDCSQWPSDYFQHDELWFETWPTKLRVIVLALDPSQGHDARRGDYSALVCVGVDERGILWVEADLARRPITQLVSDAVAWYRVWQPDAFGVETNQYQELIANELEREFQAQNAVAAAITPITNHTAKIVRIRRLGPLLAQRRIRFKAQSPGTKLLVEQLSDFPLAAHDDGPDALEMAIRLATSWLEQATWDDGLGARLI